MTLSLASVTLDCTDALRTATFWSAALDRPITPSSTAEFAMLAPAEGAPGWLFLAVPEAKDAKNRMHVDLHAADRAAEVDRLVGLGATYLADHDEWGVRWTVLQDPDGNEFCVAEDPDPAPA